MENQFVIRRFDKGHIGHYWAFADWWTTDVVQAYKMSENGVCDRLRTLRHPEKNAENY